MSGFKECSQVASITEGDVGCVENFMHQNFISEFYQNFMQTFMQNYEYQNFIRILCRILCGIISKCYGKVIGIAMSQKRSNSTVKYRRILGMHDQFM